MNNKHLPYWLIVLLALTLIVPAYLHITSHPVFASPTTYFIDPNSNEGSDRCDGLSPNPYQGHCPWKTFQHINNHIFNPGDSILLEDGETWNDTATATGPAFLHPLGSGIGTTTHGVITISDYCDPTETPHCAQAPKPILNGKGHTTATVELLDQQYWEISNLTVTNVPDSCSLQPPPTCPNANRIGVYVLDDSTAPKTYHHIVISNLTVENVVGYDRVNDANKLLAKITGGIIFVVENATAGDPPHAGDYRSNFDDVHITHNVVHDVYRSGIFFHSDWQGAIPRGDGTNYPCSRLPGITYYPSTNVVVDHNTVSTIGGTGIGVQVSTGQVISNNIVHDGELDGWAAGGIATLDSFAPVYKNNLVYNMQFHGADINTPYPDADAFDTDECDIGAIVEYNFSHDNQGGFMAVVQDSQQAIVRYNISERDGYGDPNPSHMTPGYFILNSPEAPTGGGMQVYNNAIYMDDQRHAQPGPGTGLLQNAFVNAFPAPLFENNLVENLQTNINDLFTSCSSNTFQRLGTVWTVNHNDFYGVQQPSGCPQTPTQSQGIPGNGNPQFANPGNGWQPISQQGAINAYTLSLNSPALCAGVIINSNGNGGYDFAHISLPPSGHIDAGALEKASLVNLACNELS